MNIIEVKFLMMCKQSTSIVMYTNTWAYFSNFTEEDNVKMS